VPDITRHFAGRLFLTATSLALLAGWLTATVNLYLSQGPIDGEPGLSLRDVRYRFNGNRDQNRFTAMLNGTMFENLEDPADAPRLTEWALRPGRPEFDRAAHERDFEEWVFPILDMDCLLCHEPGGKAGFAPMRNYAEMQPLLQVDRGPSVLALARLSHFHLIGMGSLVLLTGALAFAFLPLQMAGILASLAAVGLLLDVGGWWATRSVAWAAPMVVLGNVSFALGIVLPHLALLGRYWSRRDREKT